MFFVHGFPECWFSWRHQIDAFKGAYHVVAVNMRGYGESDKPRGVSNYTADKLVSDLIELIEILLEKKKASSHQQQKRIILVAHDWGGVLAWSVAQIRPDLVDRFIVLNAPASSAWTARIESHWRQFFASWYMFFFNFPLLPELMFRGRDFGLLDSLFGKYSKTKDEIDVYKHYFAQPYGITGPLNYYRARLRGYGAARARKAQQDFAGKPIEPKTLIIWGREDTALNQELAQDSARLCRDVRVEYIDGCSHWIQLERPAEVNEIMGKWLAATK